MNEETVVVSPMLPLWFCTESCASGCIEFIELQWATLPEGASA